MSGMIRAELMLLWDERLGRWPPQVLAPWLEVKEAFQNEIQNKTQTSADQFWPRNTPIINKYKRGIWATCTSWAFKKKKSPEIASSCLSDSDFCFDSVLGKLHCFEWFAAQFCDIYCFLDEKEKTPLGLFRICSSVISTYVSLFSGWSWKCVLAFSPFKFIELHSEEPLFLSVGQCVQKGLFSTC